MEIIDYVCADCINFISTDDDEKTSCNVTGENVLDMQAACEDFESEVNDGAE